ncbi:thiamine diphosphate-binding protein [Phlegmacium glaucopus]|nr:thiamine diphosphate-binding protein [Phlegmacium glaucopus]
MPYTTSSVFLQTLSAAGITHAFVNWGSDHPALLEDLERQRTENREDRNVDELMNEAWKATTNPTIITCPNEMVALSAAQGYAQVTGNPAAVIVHVDVGTQAMAGAIHNVDRSRTPVLIYAGASPFSSEGEYKGTRNEWIMWLQDVPDQTAIIRQYMRFTGQISSAATVTQSVKRALQIAKSEPKGPVYLWARREVMEEEVSAERMQTSSGNMRKWPAVEPTALSQSVAKHIALSLMQSKNPLIITSHIGRKPKAIQPLLDLATFLAIPIVNACPSTVNVPVSHTSFAGVTFLSAGTHSPYLETADTIIVIESDLPWIPANQGPDAGAEIFVIDSGDPLKVNMGSWHVGAQMILRADPEEALKQILQAVKDNEGTWLGMQEVAERMVRLDKNHRLLRSQMSEEERTYPGPESMIAGSGASFTVPNIIGVLRDTIQSLAPAGALFLNETISNYPAVWMHLQAETPGSVISSGGSSLGWALGAAVGAYVANGMTDKAGVRKKHDLIVAIVGDGSYLFGVPSSAYWMARKYDTPFLTIVLNNGGWKSPKLSMLGVYPTGHGSKASGAQLSVGFGPHSPDYAQIAVAASAGWAWGKRVGDEAASRGKEALLNVIVEAVKVVLDQRRCAVVDCVLESI